MTAASTNLVLGQGLNFPDEQLGEIAQTLQPADISDKRSRLIYEAMLELLRNGDTVDPTTVSDSLRAKGKLDEAGGMSYIAELMDAGGVMPASIATNIKIIRQEARGRRLEYLLRDGLNQLEGGTDPVVVMDRVESGVIRLGRAYEEKPQDDMVQHCISFVGALEPGIIRGQPWPWTALDETIGYAMDGRLYVVSGYSGSGKSAFIRPLALGFAMMGVKVAYFSIEEMAGPEVLGYMSCVLMGVNYIRYGWGYALTQDEIDLLVKGGNEIFNNKNLIINNEKYWSPQQLLAKTRYYVEECGCKAVVIDHAHRINYGGDISSKNELVGQFAMDMKKLMQSTGGFGIVAYQPRKPGLGGDIFRPVQPDEIRDTSVIWNEADNTLSPFRPWVKIDPVTGMTKLDASGLPIIVKPHDEDSEPAKNYFFLEPGKRRVGGAVGRPCIMKFDPISGRIDDF